LVIIYYLTGEGGNIFKRGIYKYSAVFVYTALESLFVIDATGGMCVESAFNCM
jgi:hypothetical protein